jgi:hypothetical protein
MIFICFNVFFIATMHHMPQFPIYIRNWFYYFIDTLFTLVFIPTLSYKTSDLIIEFSCGKGQKSKGVAR